MNDGHLARRVSFAPDTTCVIQGWLLQLLGARCANSKNVASVTGQPLRQKARSERRAATISKIATGQSWIVSYLPVKFALLFLKARMPSAHRRGKHRAGQFIRGHMASASLHVGLTRAASV
jgi:hypothetical protein